MTKPDFSTFNLKKTLIDNLPLDELIYEEIDLSKEMDDEQLKEQLKGLPELEKGCLIVVNDNYRSTLALRPYPARHVWTYFGHYRRGRRLFRFAPDPRTQPGRLCRTGR